jgi:glucose-6-phosphate dehydrogenase assembly protein OpcA
MTTSESPLHGIGTPVPLKEIEKEISLQLRAAQNEDDEGPVQRVRMSNLVVWCDTAEAGARLSAAVKDVVASHPARVLLLVGETAQPTADITASVLVQCRPLGKGQQACTEQVILNAKGSCVPRLPAAVRSLLIGDLPTNLWWAVPTPPPLAGEMLFDLSENVQQIIYDSIGWPNPMLGVAAMANWLESVEVCVAGRWRVASDLNWRRLKFWRRLIGEALRDSSAPDAATSITRLVVEHGPHAVVQGYELVSWLSQRLGWTLRADKGAGKTSGGTETTWRFNAAKGEVTVVVKRLPEGEAQLRRIRVSCSIDGKPVTMHLQPDDSTRMSITLEGIEAAARTVTTPAQTLADLIGRQLSDRERDPVFRQSMTVAQQLARSVLG